MNGPPFPVDNDRLLDLALGAGDHVGPRRQDVQLDMIRAAAFGVPIWRLVYVAGSMHPVPMVDLGIDIMGCRNDGELVERVVYAIRDAAEKLDQELARRTSSAPGLLDRVAVEYPRSLGR